MIEIYTTATFDELYCKLPHKIQIKADEKTELFKENPFHSTLRAEKLNPKRYAVWSFRVDLNYRRVGYHPGQNNIDDLIRKTVKLQGQASAQV